MIPKRTLVMRRSVGGGGGNFQPRVVLALARTLIRHRLPLMLPCGHGRTTRTFASLSNRQRVGDSVPVAGLGKCRAFRPTLRKKMARSGAPRWKQLFAGHNQRRPKRQCHGRPVVLGCAVGEPPSVWSAKLAGLVALATCARCDCIVRFVDVLVAPSQSPSWAAVAFPSHPPF